MASGSGEPHSFKARINQEDNFTNLYVKCFPQEYDEEALSILFGGCGPINAVKVMTDPRGRKFAFVSFEQHKDAQTCIEDFHRKDLRTKKERRAAEKAEAESGTAPPVITDHEGHPEHLLYVGRAQSKEERQALFDKKGGDKGAPKGGGAKGKGKGGTVFFDGKANGAPDSSEPASANPSSDQAPSSSASARQPPAQQSVMSASALSTYGVPYYQQSQQHSSAPYSNGNGYSDGDASSYGRGHSAYYMNGSYGSGSGYDSSYGGNYDWDSYNREGSYSSSTSSYQQQQLMQMQLWQQQQQQYWTL